MTIKSTIKDMPPFSFELIGLLRAAANPAHHHADGPLGKALNVVRTVIDRGACYSSDRHTFKVAGAVISAPTMIDLANKILEHGGLTSLRIAYPRSGYSLPEHCCAINNNGARHLRGVDFDGIGGA